MSYSLFCFPGNEALGRKLLEHPDFAAAEVTLHVFPDGEHYVRLHSEVRRRHVCLLCSLQRPDDKLMPLYLLASLAKEQGAASVTLIAPYLSYLRQDKAFQPGEAVSSRSFARMLSGWVDGLITVDPHLHRYRDLRTIYRIPTRVVHAEPLVVRYIQEQVAHPVLIGPDSESRQWVAATAAAVGCDFLILQKERLGDRKVQVGRPEVEKLRKHTPVLIDDMISTGQTMLATARWLDEEGFPPPVCIGIHGIFAGTAWEDLQQAGIEQIVTSNSIPHPTNQLDLSGLLAAEVPWLKRIRGARSR